MFWIIVLSLLAVNYLGATLLASGREPAVRIPYNPAFLEQVDKGNVKRISTQGATVDGRVQEGSPLPGLQGRAGEELRDGDPVVRDLQRA